MPIRLRIALLALIAVVGVSSALFIVYRDIDRRIVALERQVRNNDLAQRLSKLVHLLQRERGSSGGFLVTRKREHFDLVAKNRNNTDIVLTALIESANPMPPPLDKSRLEEVHRQLKRIREDVNSSLADWQITRDFYTSMIAEALDVIAVQVNANPATLETSGILSILELANVRETLGLIRATIYYISFQQNPKQRDMVDLANYYGLLNQYVHVYLRDIPPEKQAAARAHFQSKYYTRMIAVIETILRSDLVSVRIDPSQWWVRASLVIDELKELEDEHFMSLSQSTRKAMDEQRHHLNLYSMLALGTGFFIALFSILTILRILRALGKLTRIFEAVTQHENYSMRIENETKSDEFGRISVSLNNLLDVTNTLILDKERLAATDALTGIMNRRSFMAFALQEIDRATRYQTEFSFLFLDIDYFKRVNDVHGHAVGDEVLKHFVAVQQEDLRTSDRMARWGGEEFVILAPETDLEQAKLLAEKLRRKVEAATFPSVGHVTCSIGVATWRRPETFEALCERADAAVYQAKSSGRNQVAVA